MITVSWRYTPPSGVALQEHCRQLPQFMLLAFREAGNKDAVFVVSAEIASILEVSAPRVWFADRLSTHGQMVARVGSLFKIPVWLNLDNMENEVLVAEDPVEPYPLAKVVIAGLIDTTVLDRLASI